MTSEDLHDLKVDQSREKIRRRVSNAVEGECHVIYDAFDYGKDGLPIDNLDAIAYEGRIRFEDDVWEKYIGKIINNPSWLDVCIEGNNMILANGDKHHVWLEDIETKILPDYDFATGTIDFGS